MQRALGRQDAPLAAFQEVTFRAGLTLAGYPVGIGMGEQQPDGPGRQGPGKRCEPHESAQVGGRPVHCPACNRIRVQTPSFIFSPPGKCLDPIQQIAVAGHLHARRLSGTENVPFTQQGRQITGKWSESLVSRCQEHMGKAWMERKDGHCLSMSGDTAAGIQCPELYQ